MALVVETDALIYQTVAASQTDTALAVLGAVGQKGDYFHGVLVIPTTTAAGTISVKDGATSIAIYNTGTLSDLKPFFIPLNARAKNADGWKITTGANVAVIAVGRFS